MKMEQIHIAGMTCAACSARIEKALRKEKGVHSIQVSLALSRATVHYEPKEIGLPSILAKINKLGYVASDRLSHPHAAMEAEAASWRNRLIVAGCLSAPLLWAMLAHLSEWFAPWIPSLFLEPMFQLLLASMLQFGVAYPFYYGAYQALLQRSANMDTLVVISTSVAYFYSHYKMFQSWPHSTHMPLYFDAIAMILTVILLGKWLEAKAKGRALQQLDALYSLQEKWVRVKRGSRETWLPAAQVHAGERVVVKGGEWISVDGIVESGTADADESMMTGESAAVLKRAGERVYAGTRCLNGTLEIVVDKHQGDTRLAQIISLIESAQQGKPTIQRKADRVAAIFVPVMLGCAAMTFTGWLLFSGVPDAPAIAMRHALAVLLVACPCALGLATPISILIATGLSAREGILFKEGRSLERLRQTDVVLLDKTGTLTDGLPQIEAIGAAPDSQAGNGNMQTHEDRTDHILRLSAALACMSAHPLAQAVARAARSKGLGFPEAEHFRELPGKGMEARVDGMRICVGNRKWMEEMGVAISGEGKGGGPSTAAGHGRIRLHVARDGQWIGTIVLADKLRKDARSIIHQLKRKAEVRMVTGDEEANALAAAAAAGIEKVHATMQPEEKLALIRELQRQGRTVAMIGDGINDAAALAAADVGIAMGGGADAAKQAGDVVLTGGRLGQIAEAFAWSRHTMRNIHQNLFFALLYNVFTVPLAAGGAMDPRLACIGMAASSVLVVGNSLRLQLWGERRRASWL